MSLIDLLQTIHVQSLVKVLVQVRTQATCLLSFPGVVESTAFLSQISLESLCCGKTHVVVVHFPDMEGWTLGPLDKKVELRSLCQEIQNMQTLPGCWCVHDLEWFNIRTQCMSALCFDAAVCIHLEYLPRAVSLCTK